MAGDLKTNLTNGKTWLRGLLIILFAILYWVAELVVTVVAVLQFGSRLIMGETLPRLTMFARGLNAYVFQILEFVTFRSDERPFPFSAWPAAGIPGTDEPEAGPVPHRTPGERSVVEHVER
ncbi:MAG: DUF4389 domain-containing protein [Gammaproteobacteria bacterium]|nr:DUF4389 domain-containing protein [Gammaproteobacteria bacterium]